MPVEILEIMKIENILDKMEKGIIDKEILDDFPELDAKIQEQEKLKYRLNLLKRAATESADGQINSEAKNPQILKMQNPSAPSPKYIFVEDYGDSIIEKLNDEFSRAIDKAFLELAFKVNIKETNNPKFGDYQFDACIQISRRLSTGKNKISPQEVAQKILENFEKIDFVEKLEILNVYINIFVSKEHLGRKAAELCANGLTIPKIKKRHVVVDYSSPNIAKQMHVGHLRSTIIGESISRLLEFVGFSVLRINHIGDWGTQFGMLIAYLQEKFPNYLNEPPPIQDLQTFYKESKIKFDEDNGFKNRAYQCVVKLQNFDTQIVKAWQMICDISRKEFESIYEQLGIRNLMERGESFYQSRMQKIVEDLEKMGILVEEEGRKLFFPPDCAIPLTVVKSDGGYTYDTSDLATIKQRLFEEKADWVLYVVDKGQSVHLETIYAAARQLGWYDPTIQRVEHVQFGLVLGEDKKKFKTRSGDTVKLQDLMDEGVRRSEEKLRTKVNEKEFSEEELKKAAKSLAFGCIKYSDLSQSRIGDYVFSFDRMLDDRGNTAVYLLYAYTRIRSIARNACQVTREQINEYLKTLDGGVLPLDHPKEIRLTKQIMKFSDCLLFALETLQLNKICDYTYELSTSFSDFYKDCYVVSKIQSEDGSNETTKINYNRLVLCEVTADIMQRCFHILGITPIDRM